MLYYQEEQQDRGDAVLPRMLFALHIMYLYSKQLLIAVGVRTWIKKERRRRWEIETRTIRFISILLLIEVHLKKS